MLPDLVPHHLQQHIDEVEPGVALEHGSAHRRAHVAHPGASDVNAGASVNEVRFDAQRGRHFDPKVERDGVGDEVAPRTGDAVGFEEGE